MEMLHSRQSWTGYSCSAPFKYILSGPLYNKLLLAGQGLDISMAAVASELSRLEWFVDHLLMPDNAPRIFQLSSHSLKLSTLSFMKAPTKAFTLRQFALDDLYTGIYQLP